MEDAAGWRLQCLTCQVVLPDRSLASVCSNEQRKCVAKDAAATSGMSALSILCDDKRICSVSVACGAKDALMAGLGSCISRLS